MIHPLFKKRINLIIYLCLWIPLWLATIWVSYSSGTINLETAIIGAFVHTYIYAGIGIGLWFATLYSNLNDKYISEFIISHLTIMAVVIIGWLMISEFIVSIVESVLNNNNYKFGANLSGRILVGVVYYVIIIMFYYAARYYNELNHNKQNEETLKILLRDAELKALKAQINPHFLFNSLNSISMLTLEEPMHAREMLVKLSDFIRYALKQNNIKFATCKEEIDNCRKYLEIEQIRFGEKLVAEFDIQDESCDVMLPVLILQPLYENAVKHGVYESIKPITIHTNIFRDKTHLNITITNEYDPESIPRKGEGIGLSNVKERLKLEYKEDDLFVFLKKETTFIVKVKIPLNHQK